jgi:hypothetical protein
MLRRARRHLPINFPETVPPPGANLTSGQIRRRGFKMMGFGAAAFAAILLLMWWLTARGYSFHFVLIPAAFPFVLFCVGSVEAVTGAPYRRLAQRWMGLRGWQRGLLGTLIVLAALVFILCSMTFVVMMFT